MRLHTRWRNAILCDCERQYFAMCTTRILKKRRRLPAGPTFDQTCPQESECTMPRTAKNKTLAAIRALVDYVGEDEREGLPQVVPLAGARDISSRASLRIQEWLSGQGRYFIWKLVLMAARPA